MKKKLIFLLLVTFLLFLLDLLLGSVILPLEDVWKVLTGNHPNPIYKEIILNYRLPKALTAILAGSALSVSGVLMQTLFQNPLAGPDVLGITSGASLGVALLTLTTGILPVWMTSGWGHIFAASLGAVTVMLFILFASIKIRNTVSLLIVGIMFGSFAGALVSILQSISHPDTLKLFITWTFGSLSAVGWEQLSSMGIVILTGIICAFSLQKGMNALLLGRNYAAGLGISIKQLHLFLIICTSLLASTSTAFTGPIAFIGITMPHLARNFFQTSDHRIVLIASILCGSSVLLACDILSQLPGAKGTLPINAVTALFGAPLIVWILSRNQHS